MADWWEPYVDRMAVEDSQQRHNNIVDSLDADKDKAAAAAKIGKDTGADPNVIYHDFDNTTRNIRTGLTNEIVSRNPILNDYATNDPLGAKISKDDWGNLSNFLKVLGAVPTVAPLAGLAQTQWGRNIFSSTVEGARQTFGEQPLGYPKEEIEKMGLTPEMEAQFKAHPGITPGRELFLWRPFDFATWYWGYDLFTRAIEGGVGGAVGFTGQLLEELGEDPAWVNRFKRDAKILGDFAVTLPVGGPRALGVPPRIPRAHEMVGISKQAARDIQINTAYQKEFERINNTVERALPYVKEGEAPPIGLDPDLDKMIAEDSKQGIKELEDQHKAAEKTETKERSPEKFEAIAAKANKENIGIEWDGVAALYGDKVPEPGDGLLGDVPGMAEAFENSKHSGEDIIMARASFLARVSKETSEKLDGFVKHRPEAMSGRQIEALETREPVDRKPEDSKWQEVVNGVRRAGGLDPLFPPPPKKGTVRFYHGGDEPTTGGSRWVTSDPAYARDFRSEGVPNKVHYVDIPKGDPAEVALRAWDEQLDKGTAMEGRYQHGEIPEEWAKKLRPFEEPKTGRGLSDQGRLAMNEQMLANIKKTISDPIERQRDPEKVAHLEGQIPSLEAEIARLKKPVKPTQLELPGVTRQEHIPIFEPGALGIPQRMYDKYLSLWNKIVDRDAERDLKEAMREERRKQTPEWNENFLREREKVVEDIQNSRQFRSSNFFRNGILNGEDVGVKPKIRTDSLTPEQQAAIPKRFQAKNGIDPDILAGPLDYHSGAQMIDDIIAFEEMREGQSSKDFFNRVVKKETDRRMELKYGKFEENILDAARDHVISPTAFDLIHEETMALAMKAGQAMPMSKEDLRRQEALKFRDQNASKQDLIRNLRELGKAGRAAEAAWLKGDVQEAFKQKQLQRQLMAVAELAKKFQKEQRLWERNKRSFLKAENDTIEQEYLNWIQSIYYGVGEKPKRALADINENIQGRPEKTFEEFTNAKNKQGLPVGFKDYEPEYNPVIPYPAFLFDGTFNKTMKDATVGEFREINNVIQALIKKGRGERKVRIEGREYDLKEKVDEMNEKLDHFSDKVPPYNPKRWDKIKKFINTQKVALMQMEAFWRILDLENPDGLFTQNFVYPIMGAGNYHDALRKKFAERIKELDKWKTNLDEKIRNNVFYDQRFVKPDGKGGFMIPVNGKAWIQMNRENLRTVLLNYGNESNLKIMAEGYGTTVDDIRNWVDTHATKEDFQWAQAVGKIFGDVQRMEDKMTMGMNGSVIEKIPLGKVQTKFGDMDGWYYPMNYDRDMGGGPRGDITPQPKIRISTPHGWTNARTGYTGPVDLHSRSMINGLDQRLRHIAFFPVISEVSKLMLDKSFMNKVRAKFGPHYADLFEPYLKDITGQGGPIAKNSSAGNAVADMIRINTIAALVGWNPGTIIKHSASSYAQSWREVGTKAFYQAMIDLYRTDEETMKKNHEFIMKGGRIGNLDWEGSTEIQRRRQHWQETLGGSYEFMMGQDRISRMRQKSIEIGAMPIGAIDQWISKVTWLAKYREINRENLAKGMTVEEAHTGAVDRADRAVRNTHGSTMIAARPEYMRAQGALPKALTSLYGFFNHIFNRYLTMASRAAEAGRKYKRGEKYGGDVAGLLNDFAWYVVFPTAVEEYMDSTCKHGDTWASCSGKLMLQGLAAPVPVIREIAHAVISGHDPSMGILSQSYKAVTDVARDLNPKKFDKHHFGNTIQHVVTLGSVATGFGSAEAGKLMKYGFNLAAGVDHIPRDWGEFGRAARYGSTKKPKGH